MLRFKTGGFSGCSVGYSPFLDSRLVVGTSANFGLVGNGRLFILDVGADATIHPLRTFDTQDSIFATAWSESHENHVVAGCGDGGIRYFDVTTPQGLPLQLFKEHAREVFGLSWNLVDKTQFCSCSWDGTIKVWAPQAAPSSILTIPAGSACVYESKYAPSNPTSILSAHGDSTARVWDTRQGPSPQPSLVLRNGLGGDCLTVDWNKYQPTVVATAGSDKIIRVWDLRNSSAPTSELAGHQLAVKSIKWSPHSAEHLISASYDMTSKVWAVNTGPPIPGMSRRGLVRSFDHHTEFVQDVDWSLWGEPGWVASTGYDQMVYIWKGY